MKYIRNCWLSFINMNIQLSFWPHSINYCIIVIKIVANVRVHVRIQNWLKTRDFQWACQHLACDFSLSRSNQRAQNAGNFPRSFWKTCTALYAEYARRHLQQNLPDYRRHLHIRERNSAKSRSRTRTHTARHTLHKSSG